MSGSFTALLSLSCPTKANVFMSAGLEGEDGASTRFVLESVSAGSRHCVLLTLEMLLLP